MNFELTEEQTALASTAASFVKTRNLASRVRKMRDDGIGWDPAVFKEMGELGWLGVAFDEADGGLSGSFFDLAIILEKLGAGLALEPIVPSVVLAGRAIADAGSVEQKGRFLAPMIAGDVSLAFGHAERSIRYGAIPKDTIAERRGDGYTLRGEKIFVENGHHAEHIVISAMSPAGPSLFVIDRSAKGVETTVTKTIDGHRGARVVLKDVAVGADRLLGAEGHATNLIAHLLDYGAAAAVAESVGVCQVALDMTVAYLKTREQFGVKIGVFQALQHRAVDMFVEVELLRSIAMLSAGTVSSSDPVERARGVSAAKAQLAFSGRYVTQQSIQLHGGIGVTDEHDIGLYFKRQQALLSQFGDEAHHLSRV